MPQESLQPLLTLVGSALVIAALISASPDRERKTRQERSHEWPRTRRGPKPTRVSIVLITLSGICLVTAGVLLLV